MPDITTVNKYVRNYLDPLGYTDVSLDIPVYRENMWYVLVMGRDSVLGVVVLDDAGNVLSAMSYPNCP